MRLNAAPTPETEHAQPEHAETTPTETPYGETTHAETSDGETTHAETTGGETTHAETSDEETTHAETTDGETIHAKRPAARTLGSPGGRLDRFDAAVHNWLVAHSIQALRLSLGGVFLGFGVLKLFPGISPAQNLVESTTMILTFGAVPGPVALAVIGALECAIGLCLLTGRGMRIAIYLLAIQLIGILSPVVVLAPRLFSGPHHAPTLEGQYVLKDVILGAAGLVLAATLRGGRLIRARRIAPREGG
jgi:uncharacterized membrane protein YphA (DoxX/SURF4 family)